MSMVRGAFGPPSVTETEGGQDEWEGSRVDMGIEASVGPFQGVTKYVGTTTSRVRQYRKAPTSMTPGPSTTREEKGHGNSCSGDGTGLSQKDSMTVRNSATACASSDLTEDTAHDLNPETGATTAPGQSGSLVGSGSKGLDDFSASVHTSQPNASQTSDYESREIPTSTSRSVCLSVCPLSVHLSVYLSVLVFVRGHVLVRARARSRARAHVSTCVCVCVQSHMLKLLYA